MCFWAQDSEEFMKLTHCGWSMVLEIWQIVHMVLGRNGLSDFSLSVHGYNMHFSIFCI